MTGATSIISMQSSAIITGHAIHLHNGKNMQAWDHISLLSLVLLVVLLVQVVAEVILLVLLVLVLVLRVPLILLL